MTAMTDQPDITGEPQRVTATWHDGRSLGWMQEGRTVGGDGELLSALIAQRGQGPSRPTGSPFDFTDYASSGEAFIAAATALRAPMKPQFECIGLPPVPPDASAVADPEERS
jgi:hypothetical protein